MSLLQNIQIYMNDLADVFYLLISSDVAQTTYENIESFIPYYFLDIFGETKKPPILEPLLERN